MMEVLYKSDYQQVEYYEQNKILLIRSIESDTYGPDNEYFEELGKLLKIIAAKQPAALLINFKYLKFPIHPDLQDWHLENVSKPLKESKIKRLAYIIPTDVIASVALSQLFYDIGNYKPKYERREFRSEEDAMRWLEGLFN